MTFIDPRGKALRHLDRLAGWHRGEQPAPVTLEWDLSNRCPYGCTGCHFAYTHTRGPLTRTARVLPMAHDRAGDLADTTLVLRVLEEAAAAGVRSVVWTGGGEPTTHPDFAEIVEHAAGCGLQQGLYTLGALMGWDALEAVRTRCAWVVVSLDHADAITYADEKRTVPDNFAKAIAAVSHLGRGPVTVGVSFLLHARNYTQAATKMLPLARSLGAAYTTFRPLVETSPAFPGALAGDRRWVREAELLWPALAAEPDVEVDPARFREWATWQGHGYQTCYGIRLNATITPDGRLWVCPNRREFAGSCVGDLRTESFAAVWARHPGHWTVDASCRAMCRLHPINETLAAVEAPRPHEAFI
ncbi:MAG: radical SAM protein [Vicinamibacterales bacterium]